MPCKVDCLLGAQEASLAVQDQAWTAEAGESQGQPGLNTWTGSMPTAPGQAGMPIGAAWIDVYKPLGLPAQELEAV